MEPRLEVIVSCQSVIQFVAQSVHHHHLYYISRDQKCKKDRSSFNITCNYGTCGDIFSGPNLEIAGLVSIFHNRPYPYNDGIHRVLKRMNY